MDCMELQVRKWRRVQRQVGGGEKAILVRQKSAVFLLCFIFVFHRVKLGFSYWHLMRLNF